MNKRVLRLGWLALASTCLSLASIARADPSALIGAAEIDVSAGVLPDSGSPQSEYEAMLPSLSGRAGDSQSQDSLSAVLKEVWNRAPQVRQALAELEASGYDLKAARTGYLPYVQVLAAQGDADRTAVSASVVQPLWDGGLTRAQVSESKAHQKRAEAAVQLARLRVALAASEAYFNIVVADEISAVWHGYLDELQALLELVTRRADQGVSTVADVESAQLRLQQARAGAAANTGRQAAERASLAAWLSRPLDTATWPPDSALVSNDEAQRSMMAGYPAEHPERMQALFELSAQEARTRRAKASIWPRLSVQHVQRLEQQRGDDTPDNATQLVMDYQTDSGFHAFQGGRAEAGREEALREALQQVQRQVSGGIGSAMSLREAAQKQFSALIAAAESSSLLVDSYLRQFKAGRKSWLEVLNARREANELQIQALMAKRAYWAASTQLALNTLYWERLSPGYRDQIGVAPSWAPRSTVTIAP